MQLSPLAPVMAALAGLLAIPVFAQSSPAGAAATSPAYRSAFEDYRGFRDQPVASWREVNREVARVGGHAGAIKGEIEVVSPPAAMPADSQTPATSSAMPAASAPQPAVQRPKGTGAGVPATAPTHSHH